MAHVFHIYAILNKRIDYFMCYELFRFGISALTYISN
jgi:hypothetical protein